VGVCCGEDDLDTVLLGRDGEAIDEGVVAREARRAATGGLRGSLQIGVISALDASRQWPLFSLHSLFWPVLVLVGDVNPQ
jgi:predicted ABC-type ATPase